MKLTANQNQNDKQQSLPPRERGLKPEIFTTNIEIMDVAPPAGAWIETLELLNANINFIVAPPAGAWIETALHTRGNGRTGSLPPRERGLKHAVNVLILKHLKMSLPPRERGLKLFLVLFLICLFRSRSPRGSVD